MIRRAVADEDLMPGDEPDRFTLKIDAGVDSDDQERIELSRRLRRELLSLTEVESVDAVPTPAAPRSKAAAIDWQTLIVTLVASGGVLTTLIGTVQSWLTRQEKASVTLEIGGDKLVITGASSEAQQRLVNDWIRRHKH